LALAVSILFSLDRIYQYRDGDVMNILGRSIPARTTEFGSDGRTLCAMVRPVPVRCLYRGVDERFSHVRRAWDENDLAAAAGDTFGRLVVP
jgi:hypothetical protein